MAHNYRVKQSAEAMAPFCRVLGNVVDMETVRTLLDSVPKGTWKTYSEEGPYRGTRRQTHSVCIYEDDFSDDDAHQCITMGVGDDEKKAYAVANFVAQSHAILTDLLALYDGKPEKAP
jgi:hypothetical protein